MKNTRLAIIGLAAALFAATSFSSNLQAQTAPPSHIAMVNLAKVYGTMQETVEWQKRIAGMQGELKTTQESHQAQLKEIQDKITNGLKDGTDAHNQAVADLDAKSLQFALDEQTAKVKLAREANRQLKTTFDEIQATVADIAKKQGLDLVLVASNPELPSNIGDSMDFEHLAQALFNRNVLYVSDKSDITAQVLTQLDAAHAAHK